MDLTDTFLRVKMLISTTVILSLGSINSITAQSATATYTAGDIPTNYNAYNGTCNGPVTPLVVTIPAGATVTSVEVSYSMTADGDGWIEEQNSQIYCAETGNDEGGYLVGVGDFPGTLPYNRTGLTLANGISATGVLTFQMRAFRTWNSGATCSTTENAVDNNTWIIIVNYTVPMIAPGGVGSASNIALWLKADDGPLNTGSGTASTNGQTTNTWEDKSGARTNDATDATLTAPTFRDNNTDNINFNPTVDFNGTSHGLDFGNDYVYSTGTGTEDGMTWFAVVEPDNPGVTNKIRQFVIDFGRYSGRGYSFQYGNTNLGMNTPTNFSVGGVNSTLVHTNGLIPALSRFTVDFGNDQTFNLNGELTPSITNGIFFVTQLTAAEINESATHTTNNGPVTIGRQSKSDQINNNSGRRLDGSISEIIGFKEDLSVTDIRRVESYLAIKYGITLDNTGAGLAGDYESSAGTQIWDASSNLAYHNDVFGIGRSDTSAFGQVKSHSINTGAVAIFEAEGEGSNGNNSFVDIDDNEFLMTGDNGLAMTYVQSGVEPTYINRTQRIWKNQSTGSLGGITVQVILVNNGVNTDYALHTDLDGNFTLGATNYVCNSIAGDTLTFNNVIFSTGISYFTIGFQLVATGHAVATSPFCGAITVSDTIKTLALQSPLLWLKANKGTSTTTNGATISSWDDNTINAHHATQSTPAFRPVYRDNATDNLNFNPVVEFNGSNQWLGGSYSADFNKDSMMVFSVHKFRLGGSNYRTVFSSRGISTDYEGYNLYGSAANAYEIWTGEGIQYNVHTGSAITYQPEVTTLKVTIGTGNALKQLDRNGTSDILTTTGTLIANVTSGYQVGSNDNGTTWFMDGTIAEQIAYSKFISNLDKQKIETYLAIKYGVTLGHDYINVDSDVIYDISNGYANGIFGIGRSSSFELYQPKSRSETAYSGVTIEATINIGDENYLIIGHDGAAITRITLAGESNVLTRKWLAKMVKGIGTISMELDLATIGANTALPPSNVKIGISNSPTFTSTKWIQATSVVAGVAYFSGIPLYDKYFTFSAAP